MLLIYCSNSIDLTTPLLQTVFSGVRDGEFLFLSKLIRRRFPRRYAPLTDRIQLMIIAE